MSLKTQLQAWSKAILVLDSSEVLIETLIERELAGHTGEPKSLRKGMDMLPAADRLMKKITPIRTAAFREAFRLLRAKLGDGKKIDGVSFAKWASAFLKNDLQNIRVAIVNGLLSGDDNMEVARKIVGSMASNGIGGVTEIARRNIAFLGRLSIKQEQAGDGTTGEPANDEVC